MVIRTWWSCGGTFSIHTVRASICLVYWAKLWVRELPVLWVCEKEIQEKIPWLCLIEEIKWPKEVKDSSLLRKAEIITSESPSTIIEGRWSSRAKEMALIVANASTLSEEDGTWFFWTRRPSPFPSGHEQPLPTPLLLSHEIRHHWSWSSSSLTMKGSIWCAVLARHLTAFLGSVVPGQISEGSMRLKGLLEKVGKALC